MEHKTISYHKSQLFCMFLQLCLATGIIEGKYSAQGCFVIIKILEEQGYFLLKPGGFPFSKTFANFPIC